MKKSFVALLFVVVGFVLFVQNAEAAYTKGYGFGQRVVDSPGTNQVKFEFYQVTGVASGANTTLSTMGIGSQVDIWIRKASDNSIHKEFHCGSGSYSACNAAGVMDSTGTKTITGIANGTYVQESYFRGPTGFSFPTENVHKNTLQTFTGNNTRYIQRIFVRNSGAAQAIDPTIPVENRWYSSPNIPNVLQTNLYTIPYIQKGTGTVPDFAAHTNGNLMQFGGSPAVSGLPQTPYKFNMNLSDGLYPLNHAYTSGYFAFADGFESGRFKDLVFGIDSQVPSVTCTLYKKDGVTPLTNGNTGENGTAGNKRVVAKITVQDQAGLSGIKDWDVQRKLDGAADVDANWTTVATGTTAVSASNQNIDLPLALPNDYPNVIYNLRVRARDDVYTDTGNQDHYSKDQCSTNTTPNENTIVPIRVQDSAYSVTEVKLYTDDQFTIEVPAGSSVPSGTHLYGRIKVKDSSMGKLKLSTLVGGYPNAASSPNVGEIPINYPPGDPINPPNPSDLAFCNAGNSGCGLNTQWYYNQNSSYLNENILGYFEFDATGSAGTKTVWAFVDWQDLVTEENELDNKLSTTYNIGANQFFTSNGGDVGAVNGISISQDPPGGNQSNNLLVTRGTTTTAQATWKMLGYNRPLYPLVGGTSASSIYNYLRPKIEDSVSGDWSGILDRRVCEQNSTGPTSVNTAEYNDWLKYKSFAIRCYDSSGVGNNNETWSNINPAIPIQPNGNNLYIISGNLTLSGNYTCCQDIVSAPATNVCDVIGSNRCINIYIVEGDLNISTAASTVDGIFIVKGTFRDYLPSQSNTTSNPLTVNGAVYAYDMDLGRRLATGSNTNPAFIVNYRPEVFFFFENICGEDTGGSSRNVTCYSFGGREVDWKEIAP